MEQRPAIASDIPRRITFHSQIGDFLNSVSLSSCVAVRRQPPIDTRAPSTMRLLTTGAFLRAARNTRLGVVGNTLIISGPRSASSHAKARDPASFPEQSVDTKQEVDPRKTASASESLEEPWKKSNRRRFEKDLSQADENKIVHSREFGGVKINSQPYVFDDTSNLSSSILDLVGRNLYNTPNHPICITRKLIESVFAPPTFKNHTAPNPVVTTKDNFDILGFPQDHPGRSRTDTYYVDSSHVLRTHTSAHEHAAFSYMAKNPESGYTICADVYRRDSIDRSHFPVFHQMEGARTWQWQPNPMKSETKYEMQKRRTQQIWDDLQALPKHHLVVSDDAGPFHPKTNPIQVEHDVVEVKLIGQHLKRSLESVIVKVFEAAKAAGVGNEVENKEPMQVRWIEAYFPFTSPSWELEVFWQGEWLELLGCGVTQQPILDNAGLKNRVGWAWGIGVERLAMLLFGIPDIRLFWSTDARFLSQFQEGKITRYEPFSKYPACYKDVAFWVNASPSTASPISTEHPSGVAGAAGGDARKASPAETQPAAFHENDVMEIVRDAAGSIAEDVRLVDEFVHPTNGRKSLCYRINYRSLERTLTNEEANEIHERIKERLKKDLNVELR